jgi:hypothetical protein
MLRQIIFFYLAWLTTIGVHAQSSGDYSIVDRYALKAPEEAGQSLHTLAYYLQGSGKFSEREKARAIYTWITHNIRYNHNIIEQNLLGTRENTLMQQAENVLKTRSGVCEGYANLYKSLANRMGLPAEIVTGKVRKEDGQIPEIGHAWVAVKLGSEWFLSDPTWGAGSYDPEMEAPTADDFYFLVPAAVMIRDHYPFDPIWQLNRFPMTQAQWENWDLSSNPPQSASALPFYYADSIARLSVLDTLQRTLNTCARILRFNPNDDYALTQLGLKMYEQGLVALVDIYESLFELETNPKLPLDTLRSFQQLASIERFFAQAWLYLEDVKSERLRLIQEQVQPLEYMLAELLFVRGHIHYTLLSRLSKENVQQLTAANAQFLLRRMQQETERASYHYQHALRLYAQDERKEVLKKRAEIIFFQARCHYLSAISHLNGSANREHSSEESLNQNLLVIARGKNALLAMKQSIELSTSMETKAEGLLEMDQDYALLMAKFLANESLTRYDLMSSRYRLVFDNPLPFLDTKFSAALDGYRESERKAVEGLKMLSSMSTHQERQTIQQYLNAGGGLANLQIGAFQAQVAFKLHEKLVKNPSMGPKDKPEALTRIQQAQAAFGRAKPFLEKSGAGSNRMLADLQSRLERLEELKRWWDVR